jgi:hypothetical protein
LRFWDKQERTQDRRRACRYAPVRELVFLGWWKAAEFHTVTAILKDVSMGGASLVFDSSPPDDSLVWISLYKVPPTEWVEATVVDVEQARGAWLFGRRSTQIRVKFFEDCSYELFKASLEIENPQRS